MSTHKKLLRFAYEIALPYILDLEEFDKYREAIDILLVGSTATGLCREESDVDICILCDEAILNQISMQTNWNQGKPSEIIIDGIQLHYYATSQESISNRLDEADESTFYLYNTSILIYEGANEYRKMRSSLKLYSKNIDRLKCTQSKLIVRRRALHSVVGESKDPILRMKIGLEVIELLLCCIAIYDEVAYDKRKRLYQTSLTGMMGQEIKKEIDKLIYLTSKMSDYNDVISSTKFEKIVDQCIARIS